MKNIRGNISTHHLIIVLFHVHIVVVILDKKHEVVKRVPDHGDNDYGWKDR